MPIYQSIWKIGSEVIPVGEGELSSETNLEDILQKNIEILNENWLIVGRQVKTKFNKYIDLLAIDSNGSIIIIELKNEKTPRETIAQGLDYASWINTLEPEEISEIFEDYSNEHLKSNISLDKAFSDKFKITLEKDNLNNSHQIVILAPEMDSSTERIVNYLSSSEIPINVAFFKVFKEKDVKYLSRAWMIDPFETADIASLPRTKEPWNGEFYVSFGHNENRSWDDAKELGFISAGGGQWYSKKLNMLNPGDRVWVNIPHTGYVGVGKVIDTVKKADSVTLIKDGKEGDIYKLSDRGKYFKEYIKDEDKAEYIVKVGWIKTVDIRKAVSEIGFFGNQNIVCQPTTPKWTHTVDRLKEKWKIK